VLFIRCHPGIAVLPNAQPGRGGIAHRLGPLGQGRWEVPMDCGPRQRIVGPIWKRIFGCTRRELEPASLTDALVATGSIEPSRCTVDQFSPEARCLRMLSPHPNRAQSYRVSAFYTRDLLVYYFVCDAHGGPKT
jgi:hypothetical protein